MTAYPSTIAQAVARHAGRTPHAPALYDGSGRTITYAELDRRGRRVAGGLRGLGVGPGDRVAVLARNSTDFFELLLGTVHLGAVLTPLNWRLAAPELVRIVTDTGAGVLFHDAEFASAARVLRDAVPGLTALPDNGGGHAGWREAQRSLAEPRPAAPGDVALQIYTSGTTGVAKGAMLTHANLAAMTGENQPDWPAWNAWSAADVSLVTPPLFHIGGAGWALRALYAGASLVLMRDFTADDLLDRIERHRITRLALVPAMLLALLRHPRAPEADVSSLRLVTYGTAPMPVELLSEAIGLLDCGFAQSYGMTETCGTIAALGPADHVLPPQPRMHSTGRPLPGVELEIRAPDGTVLPAGEVGEICTRSAANMAGYWRRPDLTAAAIDGDGWLRTGDAGYLDAAGYLYIRDRVKDMIVSGGENVYPAEVENALYGHPAVLEAAVIGVPSERWGEEVKALVVLRPGATADADALDAWARRHIGGYKVPKSYDFVAALPRNATGKVLKHELRAPYWAGRAKAI